jgi:hypothetical protein
MIILDKVQEIRDEDRSERLDFNRTWWGAVQEGELISEDEITEVRWLISEVSSLLTELDAAEQRFKIAFENNVLYINEIESLQQQLDAAKKENERLRKLIPKTHPQMLTHAFEALEKYKHLIREEPGGSHGI